MRRMVWAGESSGSQPKVFFFCGMVESQLMGWETISRTWQGWEGNWVEVVLLSCENIDESVKVMDLQLAKGWTAGSGS